MISNSHTAQTGRASLTGADPIAEPQHDNAGAQHGNQLELRPRLMFLLASDYLTVAESSQLAVLSPGSRRFAGQIPHVANFMSMQVANDRQERVQACQPAAHSRAQVLAPFIPFAARMNQLGGLAGGVGIVDVFVNGGTALTEYINAYSFEDMRVPQADTSLGRLLCQTLTVATCALGAVAYVGHRIGARAQEAVNDAERVDQDLDRATRSAQNAAERVQRGYSNRAGLAVARPLAQTVSDRRAVPASVELSIVVMP